MPKQKIFRHTAGAFYCNRTATERTKLDLY
jgi:hypothetical protein